MTKDKKTQNKIDSETAVLEFDKWVEFKKMSLSERQDNEDSEKKIIKAIEEGSLTLDDKLVFTYTLKFPVQTESGERTLLEKLTFKPRLKTKTINKQLKKYSASDGDGRLQAHVIALTGKNSVLLGEMDTADTKIPTAIAMYFL